MFVLMGKSGIVRMKNGDPFVYSSRTLAELGRRFLSDKLKERLRIVAG